MSEPIRFKEARMESGWLMVKPEREDLGLAMAFLRKFQQGKLYSFVPKLFRKKRSLDANQKMWAIIHEMSAILRLTPEEIYQGYIPDVGDNYVWWPVRPEEIPERAEDWCRGHIGRMCEDYGPCRRRGMEGLHNLKCYRGSSEYDTATFSRLLELVIRDAQQLGIDTMSEQERSLLLEEWEATRKGDEHGKGKTAGPI